MSGDRQGESGHTRDRDRKQRPNGREGRSRDGQPAHRQRRPPDGSSRGRTPRDPPGQPRDSSRSIPFFSGTLAGAVAFLLTYAVTFAVRSGAITLALNRATPGSPQPSIPTVVGWAVYKAHFATIQFSVSGSGVSRSGPLSQGGQTSSGVAGVIEPGVLVVVPPFLLLAAGFLVVRWASVHDPSRGAVAGVSLAPGYAVLAGAGLVFASWSTTTTTSSGTVSAAVAPAITPGVLLAIVVYPLVFGALGGGVAAVTRRRTGRPQSHWRE